MKMHISKKIFKDFPKYLVLGYFYVKLCITV